MVVDARVAGGLISSSAEIFPTWPSVGFRRKVYVHVKLWIRLATAANDHSGRKSCQFWWQNWRNEDWKNAAWSDESPFLLWHLDGWVRIWNNQHESMDHCFWWWWCNGVRDIFLAYFSSWELRKKIFQLNFFCDLFVHYRGHKWTSWVSGG